MQRLMLSLALASLVAPAIAQTTVTVPNGYTNTVGGSNNAFPWNRATASMRFQQIYDSSNFTLQNIGFPVLIRGMKFRPYPGATLTWAGGSWPNIRIDMGYSAVDYTAATSTFASNLGAGAQTVYQGPVTVGAGTTLGTGVVVPWNISIPFTTNFLYDPNSATDLIFDVYLDGTGWTGTGRAQDVVSGTAGAAGPALGSRIYQAVTAPSTPGTTLTGTVGLNHSLICEFDYLPATGLYSGFAASTQTGPSPLTVNFTDQTFTSVPTGVTSWAWDFNGDAVIDSTVQNPSYIYAGCGDYTVSLTTTDGVNAPSTLTRTAYIRTDRISANFTTQVIAANTVQFTDTSNMPATTWAWDLDGDSVTDSTVQNPVWVYPSSAAVNVTLTATRNCNNSTVTKSVIPLQVLETNLAANNGGSSLWTVYFNLDVLNPRGVSIGALDVITSTLSTAFTVDMYIKNGTYSGFEYNPAPWLQLGTASGTSNAVANLPSNCTFPAPVYLPPGSYGVALRYTGVSPRYVTLGSVTTYANGDVSLTAGSAAATTVAPFTGTSTTVNTPRGWSGRLYYDTQNVVGTAATGTFAKGCAGTQPISALSAAARPSLGSTFTVTANNLPFNTGIMALGLSRTSSVFGPLPLDLSAFGAPGCTASVSSDATAVFAGTGGSATWTLALPATPTLAGLVFYNQAYVVDPTANLLGFVTSNAIGSVLGN